MEIIKKAYQVWHEGMLNDNPHEGFRMDELPITYANTPGEAKTKAEYIHDSYIDDRPHKYTDLKVRRAKKSDKIMFEGQIIPKHRAERELSERKRVHERINKINQFPNDAQFYIQRGYVGNAVLWWALNSNGYTCDIHKAQKYTKEEVLNKFVNGREDDLIWESNHVLDCITEIVDGQFLKREFVA